jgi:hypothetical protein
MPKLLRKTLNILICALMAALILGFVWPVVGIWLRLHRNQPIAQRLVRSLQDRFPGMSVGGGASYREELVSLVVRDHLDEKGRNSVENWLRAKKAEQKIAPQIRLRFLEDDVELTLD